MSFFSILSAVILGNLLTILIVLAVLIMLALGEDPYDAKS